MPEVFRTPASPDRQTEALVVHCSAARVQRQFHSFLVDGLRLQSYSLIALPGGIQILTLLDYLPKFSWAGWRWVKFLVDLDKPPRIILVGHQDCRWYRDLRFRRGRGKSSRDRIVDDLKAVAAEVTGRFPAASVETYYLAEVDGQAVFEAV